MTSSLIKKIVSVFDKEKESEQEKQQNGTSSKKEDRRPVYESLQKSQHKPVERQADRSQRQSSAKNRQNARKKPASAAGDAVWNPAEFQVEAMEGKIRFHDLDLHPKLMRSIHALDWRYATPIQGEILPDTLKGKDMAGRAQTGTGKTGAFLITIINRCLGYSLQNSHVGTPRALIIAPTRELAIQIGKDAEGLNRFSGLRTVALYGGMDYNKQQRNLENGNVDIVVATPGRLLDFENRQIVKLHSTEIMVIDEADRMLDMGFIPDVRRIIHKIPPKEKRQTMLFSATLSSEVMRFASAWMVKSGHVDIEPQKVAVDTVEQKVLIVTDDRKFQLLYNIIKHDRPERILIFTNRREQAERLAEDIYRYGHQCEMLSGAVTQKKRMRILEEFRTGTVKVLVATDVAGRGIHVSGISHVVNFNIPENPDDYVHRIGRTGRAGAIGQSITFACEMESFELPKIEKLLGMELKCSMPPKELFEELPKVQPRRHKTLSRKAGGKEAGRRGRHFSGGRLPRNGNHPARNRSRRR